MKEEAEDLTNHIPVVWIPEERAYGVVKQLGAFMSLVEYESFGHHFRVWLENDEFEIVEHADFKEEQI